MSGCPDLVVIGNLVVDDVVFENGTTRMAEPGGAVLYAALGAALWNVSIGIVSVAGTNYPSSTLDGLQRKGICLDGVRRLAGPGVRAWLLYEPGTRRILNHLNGPTRVESNPVPDDVPASWRRAPIIHCSPFPLDLQAPVITSLAAAGASYLSLDPHTSVEEGTLETWRPVLRNLDAFFVSEIEVELPGCNGDADAVTRARELGRHIRYGRLRTVALKLGSHGGVLLDDDGVLRSWSPRTAEIVDPTGAGDAFAGGFLAAVARRAPAERALRQAVVSASFAIEGWGAAALMTATPRDAEARLLSWYGAQV